MANPKRGEMTIVLGEKKYKARVTLDVVKRIEDECGLGIVKVTQALSQGDLTTTHMINILTPAIRAGGNDVNAKEVGDALWGAGLVDGMKSIGEILSTVLSAGEDEGNEEKAEDNRLV